MEHEVVAGLAEPLVAQCGDDACPFRLEVITVVTSFCDFR
jgi:hypothetical protein